MARIKSYDDWSDYMKELARKSVHFNPGNKAEPDHFYPFSEELVGNDLNFPALILMPDEFGVVDNKSDNIHLQLNPEFWISIGVKKGDIDAEKTALKKCFDLAWDVLAYIYEEYNALGFNPDKSMTSFDANSIRMEQHQPFGKDRALGYRVMLSFANPKALAKNPANWR